MLNESELKISIAKALSETKRGVYLRSYHNRVAHRAVEIYKQRRKGLLNT